MAECEIIRYVVNKDIMPLYIDTAKTYMNLSAGALALTITFREKVIGSNPGDDVGRFMIASWVFFLLAIGSSSAYQYFAVKFLDSISCSPGSIQIFEHLVRNPGNVYFVMLLMFCLGAIFLVISAWRNIFQK